VFKTTVPLHCGVKLYHTSGSVIEPAHGSGMVGTLLLSEGVAQAVVPQATGLARVIGMAFEQ
jgi:hypothetical protein